MVEITTRLANSTPAPSPTRSISLGSRAPSGIERLATDRRISGRVLTVKLEAEGRPVLAPPGYDGNRSSAAGDIIVVEQRTGLDAACWGGNLSLGAQLRSIAGVIVEGPARDIDERAASTSRVFARSRTPAPRADESSRLARTCRSPSADVTVRQATSSSPTAAQWCSSPGEIARVLEAAEAIAAREGAMVAALNDGQPVTEVMGENYETCSSELTGSGEHLTTPTCSEPRGSTPPRSAMRWIASASPGSA